VKLTDHTNSTDFQKSDKTDLTSQLPIPRQVGEGMSPQEEFGKRRDLNILEVDADELTPSFFIW
jgi:hypothetical protein